MLNLTEAEFRVRLLASLDAFRALLVGEEDEWLTPREAQRLTGLKPDTLKKYQRAGVLECRTTAGGHRRYSKRQMLKLSALWEGPANG